MEEKLLNTKATGAWLGKSDAALAQWRYLGLGPKFVKVGRSVRYKESEISRWLDAQTHQQTGERATA